MAATLKFMTTVQPRGRIEVLAPDLPTGQEVEVTVSIPSNNPQKRSVLDILAEVPGHQLFKTAAEVDEYIREERDSWDRQ